MFVNCHHCNALVATDPATDRPPERCPRCAGKLRDDAPAAEVATAHTMDATADVTAAGISPTDANADTGDAWRHAAGLVASLAGAIRTPSTEPVDTARTEVPHGKDDPTPDAGQGRAEASAADLDEAEGDAGPADDAADILFAAASEHEVADGSIAAIEVEVTSAHDDASPAHDAPGIDGTPEVAETAAPAAVLPAAKPAPSFIAARPTPHAAPTADHRWLVIGALAVLSLSLLLQILLADRARLAEDAQWRPLLSTLCNALGCTLPPWREPGALALVARDVRPDPARPGVLRVSATFRNDARWSQAWPRMALTLSDVDGRAVGTRTFAPREYLGDEPDDAVLSSGQSAMIRLDVIEPAANVVAFSFEFH